MARAMRKACGRLGLTAGVAAIVLAALIAPTGAHAYTLNGWNETTIDPSPGVYTGADVSCASSTFCVAEVSKQLGDAFGNGHSTMTSFVSVYDGRSWGKLVPLETVDWSGRGDPRLNVSCVSATMCLANAASGALFQFTGSSWIAAPQPPGPAEATYGLSCVSTTCVAVLTDTAGALLQYSATYTDGAWSAETLIPFPAVGGYQYESISCATASFCGAGGIGFVGTAGDGDFEDATGTLSNGVWAAPALNPLEGNNTTPVSEVSCPRVGFCLAVGATRNFDTKPLPATTGFVYSFGPASVPVRLADSDGAPSAVGCSPQATATSPVLCVAADSLGNFRYTTTPGFSQWSASALFDPIAVTTGEFALYGPSAVSCPTTSFCAAIDPNGHALTLTLSPRVASESTGPVALAVAQPPPAIAPILHQGGYARVLKTSAAGTVTDSLVAATKVKTKGASATARKQVQLASAHVRLTHRGRHRIHIRLTSAGRRLLRHKKSVAVIETISFTPRAGRHHRREVRSAAFDLRR